MFEYFIDNYTRNMVVATLVEDVGTLAEPFEAFQSVAHLSGGDRIAANAGWYDAMVRLGEKLERLALGQERVEFVDIPYEGGAMPALLIRALGEKPAPILIQIQGFDSVKETQWPMLQSYRARGLSLLIVGQPGAGASVAWPDGEDRGRGLCVQDRPLHRCQT
jgi:hypothetical protein